MPHSETPTDAATLPGTRIDAAAPPPPTPAATPVPVLPAPASDGPPPSDDGASGRRRRLVLTGVFAALGGLLYGYDTGVISGALLAISQEGSGMVLDEWQLGLVTSLLLLGAAFGSFFGGTLADKLGRKRLLRVGAVIFVIAATGCAVAPGVETLIISRFLLGLGLGTTSVVVPLYLGETAPSRVRGRMVSMNTVMINVGQAMAVIINAGIGVEPATNWRIMLGAAVIPAILFAFGNLFTTETPNWYAQRGRDREARDVLLKTRTPEEAERELYLIKETIKLQKQNGEKANLATFIRTPWMRRVLIVGIGIVLINQLTGINTIVYYGPTILSRVGFDTSDALVAAIPMAVVGMTAALIGGLGFIDRFNRRSMLSLGLAGVIGTLALLSATYLFIDAENPTQLGAWLILGTILVYLAFMQGMVSPATWLLIAEVFPARLRGSGMGIAILCMNLSTFVISLLFLPVMRSVGGAGTFLIFALINIGSLWFTRKVIPETRGKTLEEIELEARSAV